MALLHITSSDAWKEIQASEQLTSRVRRGIQLPGPDGDRVSAFSGVDLADRELLLALRQVVFRGKQSNRAVASQFSSPEELVMLEIQEGIPGVSWEICPRVKQELVTFLGLSQELCDRMGEYVKTPDAVPLAHVREITL